MVGVLYVAMGLLRLGFVTNFLSHPVISGFTSGSAIIIGFSQVKYMLGYHIERSEHIYEVGRSRSQFRSMMLARLRCV